METSGLLLDDASYIADLVTDIYSRADAADPCALQDFFAAIATRAATALARIEAECAAEEGVL